MLKAALRSAAHGTVRQMVAFSWSREAMNSVYLKLSPSSRTRFHREFARLFRNAAVSLNPTAVWQVKFAERTLQMPLDSQNLWQEWDSAVSIIANDMEVKQTYEGLLTSGQPPDLFVDIGANYGTHSLLFLAAGVEALTFEPNGACHDYFLRTCALNRFSPKLEGVAMGAQPGHIVLSYPPRDTWFGSTNAEAVAKLEANDLVTVQVEQRTLDDYLDRMRHSRRMLLKIDTEGNELSVLQGARGTLAQCKPTIIFEALTTDENRPILYEYLRSFGYTIGELPVRRAADVTALTQHNFVESRSTNFIAVLIT